MNEVTYEDYTKYMRDIRGAEPTVAGFDKLTTRQLDMIVQELEGHYPPSCQIISIPMEIRTLSNGYEAVLYTRYTEQNKRSDKVWVVFKKGNRLEARYDGFPLLADAEAWASSQGEV